MVNTYMVGCDFVHVMWINLQRRTINGPGSRGIHARISTYIVEL